MHWWPPLETVVTGALTELVAVVVPLTVAVPVGVDEGARVVLNVLELWLPVDLVHSSSKHCKLQNQTFERDATKWPAASMLVL